ncbi:MerR family transcriptional regulator [Candidatus Dependentiae bacterium]|nr:MerR family transcriptional regulator [Candidatus Dependentiae bacterium]
MIKRKKGFFSISAVAEMFSVHQQTIRLYEKEGLLTPKRSEGNTRMFSEEDVNRLEEIIYLTHQLGINLAGVQMILKLQRQIKRMQQQMNTMFDAAKTELDNDAARSKMIVQESAQKLLKIRKPAIPEAQTPTTPAKTGENEENWQIEYEE